VYPAYIICVTCHNDHGCPVIETEQRNTSLSRASCGDGKSGRLRKGKIAARRPEHLHLLRYHPLCTVSKPVTVTLTPSRFLLRDLSRVLRCFLTYFTDKMTTAAFTARALPRTLAPRVLRPHALRLRQWQCRQLASVATATQYGSSDASMPAEQNLQHPNRQDKIITSVVKVVSSARSQHTTSMLSSFPRTMPLVSPPSLVDPWSPSRLVRFRPTRRLSQTSEVI
jgi:hypothetical protein